jgi:hypothetical protein
VTTEVDVSQPGSAVTGDAGQEAEPPAPVVRADGGGGDGSEHGNSGSSSGPD